jgi:hypothetical protein
MRLVWRPQMRAVHELPQALADALARNSSSLARRHFGAASVRYLEGLKAEGVDGEE